MRLHISTLVVVFSTVAAFGVLLGQPCAGAPLSHEVLEYLRSRIETAGVPPRIAVGEETIYSSVALPRFYERQTYQPAWIDDHGPLPRVSSLIQSIKRAEREGLKPVDYHLNKIEAILNEVLENKNKKIPLNPRRLVDLDLLLTDAFLIYGSHLLAGRVNPETIDSEWHANRREADLAAVLQGALESNRIEDALESLLPSHQGYFKLREALVRYRNFALDIRPVMVPEGLKMQKGDHGERVKLLRTRLMDLGDLKPNGGSPGNSDLFDDPLEQAVRRFQKRHGLDLDGVVGPATLAALNVPVERRVRQIMLNMERWRWLPQDLGQRFILVNIANFELDVTEGSQPALAMRVIVGRGYRRTPVFSAQMTYLVLSPYWHVPPNIAVQDKLPEIRKDPDYLEKQHMRVFQGWGAEAKELDPKSIDWSKVTAKTFQYRLRQDPGPWNALGQVKFMFPNKFNVYLHDTPSRELFGKIERAFSSGCIRIEKPIELAEYLLRDDPKWNRGSIIAAIEKRVEQTVQLPKPISVHLLYWTAWVDDQRLVQFRDDLYGRDALLDAALHEPPPDS